MEYTGAVRSYGVGEKDVRDIRKGVDTGWFLNWNFGCSLNRVRIFSVCYS